MGGGTTSSLPLARPLPPPKWSFYHGSQWVVLSRKAMEYLATDGRARALARHVRLTHIPIFPICGDPHFSHMSEIEFFF